MTSEMGVLARLSASTPGQLKTSKRTWGVAVMEYGVKKTEWPPEVVRNCNVPGEKEVSKP